MHLPTITANYLAILALIYAALALQVDPAAAEQQRPVQRRRQ